MTRPEPLAPELLLERLPERPSAAHAQARRFCLDTIREVYGTDYRRDWHLDLDGLLGPAADNHYGAQHGGAFWTLRDAGGIVGTAGIRGLRFKPEIPALFPGRYPAVAAVAFLGRVYLRRDRRGRGLGRRLAALAEAEAARLGYATMYLHAGSDAPAALAFWHALGYRRFATRDGSTHFDKPIAAAPPV